jgi:hypothetical protein
MLHMKRSCDYAKIENAQEPTIINLVTQVAIALSNHEQNNYHQANSLLIVESRASFYQSGVRCVPTRSVSNGASNRPAASPSAVTNASLSL